MKRNTSIAIQVIVVVATLTLVFLSGAGVVGYHLLRIQEEKELEALTSALAEQAGTGLALPLWNFDKEQIRKASESILKVPAANAVVVAPSDSKQPPFALSKQPGNDSVLVETGPTAPGLMRKDRSIVHSGSTIGSVQVFASSTPMTERMNRFRLWLVCTVVATAGILSAALYFLLWRMVINPIRLLEHYSLRTDDKETANSGLEDTVFLGELESLKNSLSRIFGLLDARYDALQREARRFKESEERFRILVDTIPDLIWLKDKDGIYVSCNRMFERFFGASEGEIVGKTDFDFVDPELAGFFREHDRAAMAAGKPTRNEESITFADNGAKAVLETTKTPMVDADGRVVGVLGIGRDITERKLAEDERRILDERMGNMRKLEALGVLVAGVAHNFNNVLAGILGTASLRESDASDPDDKEAYAIISSACRRGRDVVRSLMQFSKPTLSHQAPFEVHSLLSEIRVLLENSTRNRIRIVEDFASAPLWSIGDAGSVSNSFMNICINAIDAMPDGGTVTLRTLAEEGDWIRIEIEDTGEGIQPENMSKVLDPFFTTKEIGKGTGLGLSMTHGVIKAHGGSFALSSSPGIGTVARIRLRRIPRPAEQRTANEDRTARKPLHVFLVDDDEDIRYLMTRMLKTAGNTVESFSGALEALERLGSEPAPDLVIMDQNMPGMDGLMALGRIRETHPSLLVLISSGQLDIQNWDAFRQPNVGVLSKPFDMKELRAKLDEFAPTTR